ncbi:hypothetical protein D3C83_127480 [compost metagenome]
MRLGTRMAPNVSPISKLVPMYSASTSRWSTPNTRISPTCTMKAMPKKKAMPRSPWSLPRRSKVR